MLRVHVDLLAGKTLKITINKRHIIPVPARVLLLMHNSVFILVP